MTPPLVAWTEIPVRDVAGAVAFYDAVLGTRTTIETAGPSPRASLDGRDAGVGCSVVEGAPGAASVIHFAVPDLDAAIRRVSAAGGRLDGAEIAIPPGRDRYAFDPEGNRLGLFEPRG